MMSRRARALFAGSLAFALLPILSWAVAHSARAHSYAAMAWVQPPAKSPTAVQSVRGGTHEAIAHHLKVTPLVPARRLAFVASVSRYGVDTVSERARRDVTLARLHPARAPPAAS
jgi:hypothetical protein